MSFLRLATRAAVPRLAWTPAHLQHQHLRRAAFSTASGLTRDAIKTRIFEVLKGFEKVDVAKMTETSTFATDLGLDSLDAVEVVMAVEEEFQIEIPDAEADSIQSVQQAIEYIEKTPAAH